MPVLQFVTRDKLKEFYGADQIPVMDGNRQVQNAQSRTLSLGPSVYRVIQQTLLQTPDFVICSLAGFERNGLTAFKDVLLPKRLIETRDVTDFRQAIEPLLDSRMPGRWFRRGDYLYLYYPELEMTNKNHNKHVIYDMVVRVLVFHDYRMSVSFAGCRFSFTPQELLAGYIHSHLHANHYNFDSFCLGTGGMPNLMVALSNHVDLFGFDLFLSQLENYLKWESLEGTPYISMMSVNVNNVVGSFPDTAKDNDLTNELILRIAEQIDIDNIQKFIQSVGITGFHFSTLSSTDLFNMEMKAVESLLEDYPEYGRYLYDYDPSLGTYFYSLTPNRTEFNLPQLDSEQRDCVTHLSINSRIVETEVKPIQNTIKRVKPSIVNKVLKGLNAYVQQLGFYDEQNNV